MTRCLASTALALTIISLGFAPTMAYAQAQDPYEYHQPTQMLMHMGTQALVTCNGLFVSNLSVLVAHKGDIVFERYAPGVDMTTKTRTWSTAKNVAVTLVGLLVGEGKLALDEPLPYTN